MRLLAPLLAAEPEDSDACAALALRHLARGQLGAASLVCARADENHAGAAYACGLVAAEAGELHVAEGRLRASLSADPEGAARGPLAELLFRMRGAPAPVVVVSPAWLGERRWQSPASDASTCARSSM